VKIWEETLFFRKGFSLLFFLEKILKKRTTLQLAAEEKKERRKRSGEKLDKLQRIVGWCVLVLVLQSIESGTIQYNPILCFLPIHPSIASKQSKAKQCKAMPAQ
jgi:hypothetical protein